MIWHSSDIADVVDELKSNIKTGLSSEDAAGRLQKINSKIEKKKDNHSYLKYLSKELKQPVYYIIFISIAIALLFHLIFNTFSTFDIVAIIIMTFVKAGLGAFASRRYVIEINKSESVEKSTIRVLRDGTVSQISSRLLVPGDIIQVNVGDYIPADARLLAQNDLHCDEFSVTGESIPTPKDAFAQPLEISDITERGNMIFAGSYVVSGNGVAIVTEITDYTEYGKQQKLDGHNTEYSLEIEPRLNQLSKLIGIGATVVYSILFLIALIFTTVKMHDFAYGLASSLILIGALSISFIPASINLIATAAVSRGIRRMKKKGISIYQSSTVDSIAKLDVICADKTGTFTRNKMLLSQMYNGSEICNLSTEPIDDNYKMLLRLAALCCDGEVKMVKGVPIQTGDATQTAIIAASIEHLGMSKYDLDNIYPRMHEIPFDPERKLMTTINVIDGKNYVIVRGSPKELIEKCSNDCSAFIKVAEDMSASNLRVVAVATKPLDDDIIAVTPNELESNLQCIGILGLSDIPRLDSKPSVVACQEAGMKVVMITGDHKSSAFITAQKLNIAFNEEQLLTGEQLDEIDDDTLCEEIDNYTVFAEVNSSHRLRIINAYKNNGHHVAITGDNATDTEALRNADVGYSMGNTGSDVAICASEVIIEDDSFSTVVDSVRDCRGIYNCISKSIKFFLSAALGIITSLLLGIFIFKTPILTSPEIIFIAIAAISLMSLGIVYEPSEEADINLIVDNDFDIFKIKFLFDIVFNAAIYAISLLVSYSLAFGYGISPSSFTFLTSVLFFIISAFISRSSNKLISFNLSNTHFNLFSAISLVATFLLLIIAPGLVLTQLKFVYWLMAILCAVITGVILLAIKFIRN